MMFELGDIIVYDARVSHGPSVKLVGVVTSRERVINDHNKSDWNYKITWWKGGKLDCGFQVLESIAREMSFPRIGNIWPLDYGVPELIAYTKEEAHYVGTITL